MTTIITPQVARELVLLLTRDAVFAVSVISEIAGKFTSHKAFLSALSGVLDYSMAASAGVLRKNSAEFIKSVTEALVAGWMVSHQNVEASKALEACKVLGADTAVAYQGDVSLLDNAITEAKAASDKRAIDRTVRGLRVDADKKRLEAVLAHINVQVHNAQDKEPYLAMMEAHAQALLAEVTRLRQIDIHEYVSRHQASATEADA
jgi:hypothetical protein